MFDFDKAFPIFQNKTIAPICVCCDGRSVVPQGNTVVTCPKCNGTGKQGIAEGNPASQLADEV